MVAHALWCPRGLALVSLWLTAPAVSSVFGSQRIFLHLFSGAPRPRPCLMSRGDELRQLAAQLSVLAALEDSVALGLSRVMGPAGSGRSAAPAAAGSPTAPRSLRWVFGRRPRPATRSQRLWCAQRPSRLPVAPCLAVMTCAGLQPSSPRLPSSRTPLRSASPGSWAALAPAARLARSLRSRYSVPGCVFHVPSGAVQPRGCKGLARAQQPPRQPPPGPAPGLALLCRCPNVHRVAAPAPPPACVARSPLAESGLVTGMATKCCPPVLPAQLRLSRVSRALHAASVASPPPVDASRALCTLRPCLRGLLRCRGCVPLR